MFGDGLGHAVENAFQIINLPRVLHLHEYDFSLAFFGLDVPAVELVGFIYSSRQELKFDTPLPSNTENGNARSDYGPPGEGDIHPLRQVR